MPTLTKFVELRHMENGDPIYSFKMNDYLRQKLNEVPNGTFVRLRSSQYGEHGFALYWQEKKS